VQVARAHDYGSMENKNNLSSIPVKFKHLFVLPQGSNKEGRHVGSKESRWQSNKVLINVELSASCISLFFFFLLFFFIFF
jgi:hypothetical protein